MEAFGADSVDLSIFASYNITFRYRSLRGTNVTNGKKCRNRLGKYFRNGGVHC